MTAEQDVSVPYTYLLVSQHRSHFLYARSRCLKKSEKDVLEPFGNFVSALGGTTGEAACLMACFRCFAYLGTGVLDATYQSLQ